MYEEYMARIVYLTSAGCCLGQRLVIQAPTSSTTVRFQASSVWQPA
jgi:hypothetical protein